jgi:tetratricopeptide (TPR) repeat protein
MSLADSHRVGLPAAAVLVVHGPTGASLTALRQLTAIVGDPTRVSVVAGTEPGLTAAQRAGERGHFAPADHGPAELARVLATLDGPVLVVHDDVELSATSAANLLAAHSRTDCVAIPTGDKRSHDRKVETTNLVCAVAESKTLLGLALGSAFGPGIVVTGDFVEAAHATMVHRGDCQQRLSDPERSGRPVLVAGVIVRDEEADIDDCLASLAGLVDRIEVADTGSVDRTVERARAAGANVSEIGWRDDFAWARNEVLDRCRDASYMIWVDADERLVCPDPRHLRRVLATYGRLYPSYALEIKNYDDDGIETHRFVAKRIIDPSLTSFEGAIHEQPRRVDGTPLLEVPIAGLSIDHHGYAGGVVDSRQKPERNLQIARESFERVGDEASAVHLARSLKAAAKDPVEAIAEIQPLVEMTSGAPAQVRALMVSLVAELRLVAGDYDRAVTDAQEALALVPADAVAGAVLAEALVRLGRPDEALEAADELRAMPSPSPLVEDYVAGQTRAAALFEAAIQIQDADRARGLVADLPRYLDPWPALSAVGGVETLVASAATAGRLGDGRILTAMAAHPELTGSDLRRGIDAFTSNGGSIDDSSLIDAALSSLGQVDEAPSLRGIYDQTGAAEDALTYAQAVAAVDPDLLIELDRAGGTAHPISRALAVAAEAQWRRGRSALASIDAAEALSKWRGAARAAAVVAELALSEADVDAARAVTSTARAHEDYDTNPVHVRDQVCRLAARARLITGDVAGAVSELVDIVGHRSPVDMWPELLDATGPDLEALAVLLGLALLTDGEEFIVEVARSSPPARTATICASYLAAAGPNPDAVTTGILAALMTSQHELAEVIAGFSYLVPGDIRARLEEHLRETGATQVAEALSTLPVS